MTFDLSECLYVEIYMHAFIPSLYVFRPTSGGVVTLKIGRRELPGSNPGRACRPSLFGVFRGFLRNSRKYRLGFLRKTPTEGTPPIGPGSTSGQLALHLRPTNQSNEVIIS